MLTMLHLKSNRHDRGFSLIELLVVMGILAALTLVAIPWFLKLSQRNQLKSAAREIQSTLLAARIKAVNRNRPVSVAITTLGPPVEFQTTEPNPPAPTPTHVPVNLNLPGNVRLQETPRVAGGTIVFGGDGRLASPPVNQLTPGYQYVLEGPVGALTPNRITIKTDTSGRIAVITPVNWY